MNQLRRLLLSLVLLLSVTAAFASSSNAPNRNVDDNDTVPVPGSNVHPNARPEFDQGPTDTKLTYEPMMLVLPPRAGSKDTVDRLLTQLHDPTSPRYHQRLTPPP